MSGWVAGAVVVGSVASGYLASKGAKDAARTSADASDRSAALSNEQYLQDRQDLAPYRAVATGEDIYGNQVSFDEWYKNTTGRDSNRTVRNTTLLQRDYEEYKNSDAWNEVTGRTEGALNTLADYGRSQVNPGDYIPDSQIPSYQGSTIGDMPNVEGATPEFNVSGDVSRFGYQGEVPQYDVDQNVNKFNVQGDIPQFNVQGDIPEFDSTQFDIYKDPSYEWRKEEMLRGLDRTSGATGKITSGNRLDEIMTRTGDMASQEYGAARDRMVQDYDIRRQNESSQYGRDVSAYDYGRQNEATEFGRDLTTYDANRGINQEAYNRANYGYGQDVSSEASRYGRATGEYGLTRGVEQELYGRDLTGYDANRSNALTQYGFDTDAYNRAYGRDTDQYGRDLTTYNADVSRESGMYGRGVSDYNRAYSQEGDYLNRLAALSKTGQTAVNSGVTAGGTYTTNAGNALQAAGNAQAAGIIGQSNAYANTLSDLSMAGGYALQQYNKPAPYADPWVSNDPSVWGK